MKPRAYLPLALLAISAAVACGPSLPEPESEAAQLYVKNCSGAGCHGAIPPQGSSYPYWENQYDRMLVLMEKSGWTLPTPAEDRIIKDYLKRHARGGSAG